MIVAIPGRPSLSYFSPGGVAVAWQKSSWGRRKYHIPPAGGGLRTAA